MTDQKTGPKKTTPESTRRFRLTLAALRSVEEAADHEVGNAIQEFESFKELYIAARLREVDNRTAQLPTQGLDSTASGLEKSPRGTLYPMAQQRAFSEQEKAYEGKSASQK